MLKRWVVVAVAAGMLCCVPRMLAQAKGEAASPEKITSIADKTAAMQKMAGHFNIYWDAKARKLWLEIDPIPAGSEL